MIIIIQKLMPASQKRHCDGESDGFCALAAAAPPAPPSDDMRIFWSTGRIDAAIISKLVTEQTKRTKLYQQAATLVAEQTETMEAATSIEEERLIQETRAEALLMEAT